MADIPHVVLTYQGYPLESVGLDDVIMIDQHGNWGRLTGIIIKPGFTIVDSVLAQAGEGATVLYDVNKTLHQLELRLH